MRASDAVAMRVGGIVVDPESKVPVLVLRGVDDPRLYLPIFIGGLEATAIAAVLAEVDLPRPMTHDLMVVLLGHAGCSVEQVCVTALEEGTFFAEITVVDAAGERALVDARPSDAVALALRVGASIWVAPEVVAEAGAMAPEDEVPPDDGDGAVATGLTGAEDDQGDPSEAGRGPDEGAFSPRGLDATTRLEDLDPEMFGKYKM